MSKSKNKIDPFAEREAAKYDRPIPSREFIIKHLKDSQNPVNFKKLSQNLGLRKEDAKEALRRRLKAMLRDGQLEQLRKRRFWPLEKRLLVEGTLFFDRKKNLWCTQRNGGSKILIPMFNEDLAFAGNRVIVAVPDIPQGTGQLKEGKIVEVLEQPKLKVTGRFIEGKDANYLIPYSKDFVHDIVIPPKKQKGARHGDIVLVKILVQQSCCIDPMGQVIEVIGHKNAKGVEIEAAIHEYKLPYRWSTSVKKQVDELSKFIFSVAKRNRVDIRALPLVTIDGEDARDFDDAVYCELRQGGGWRLYVAIADVSYYVQPDTELDAEAKLRGNSVYFPGKVIPMLPEVLSNELCSLIPNVDRLCIICEMTISDIGKLTRYQFYEGIIRSHARLTYTKVAAILNGESKYLLKNYANIVNELGNLHSLYKTLRKQRELRGAIDFKTTDTHLIFDINGKIRCVKFLEQNVAHRIIEECMLCANVATAKFLKKHKISGIYRVHEGPPEEKVSELRTFLSELGLDLGKAKCPEPLDYGQLLRKIKDRPDANVIQTVLLRSLSQAGYSSDNLGHFGLAFSAYTHFTSPIRRYADLLLHRQIKTILHGKLFYENKHRDANRGEINDEKFKDLARHCSMSERRADDATRYVEQWLKCQYMSKHIGRVFNGIISGLNRFGFFVELDGIYIDGLVHINSLTSDYYLFDPIQHSLTGERSGKKYILGMFVNVVVVRVDVDERKIDFEIAYGVGITSRLCENRLEI